MLGVLCLTGRKIQDLLCSRRQFSPHPRRFLPGPNARPETGMDFGLTCMTPRPQTINLAYKANMDLVSFAAARARVTQRSPSHAAASNRHTFLSRNKPITVRLSFSNNNNNNNNNNNGLITLQKLIGSSMLHKYLSNYNIYITITMM